MQFTPEQEENLVKQYDKLIRRVVNRFKLRSNYTVVSREDLYQECMLVFIAHIRKAQNESQLGRIPFRDMVNAMCRYTLMEQNVSVPIRTTDYRKRMSSMKGSATLEEADWEMDPISFCEENVVTTVAFSSFMNSLSDQDRQIVKMKMHGFRNKEVSKALGLTDVIITRRLKRIRTQYALTAA